MADASMTVGVVGLGLIGGSFAKAYADAGIPVYGADIDEGSLRAALAEGTITGVLDQRTVPECTLIIIALYPAATVSWLSDTASHISPSTLVMDCGGVKRSICPHCFLLAQRYGFVFFGGHPMAGTHKSGFRAARSDLYVGQPMVLVPPETYDPAQLYRFEQALSPVGFGSYSVTSASRHDQVIAYTSQLAHVVSSAFIKSPTALQHTGFSAGSYKDLTRVAELNPDMWTELFLDNADNLQSELDLLIQELERYRDALAFQDEEALRQLLAEGTEAKLKADGRFPNTSVATPSMPRS
ncbi:MAG: prephenate dehydrogenase/arogenate dehydrogenase family protein [Eggerthellales bacterium]|nr:prephenate dehydrogenase/arogenate dehydrogenase family protein [Eggerthellales bacterium]